MNFGGRPRVVGSYWRDQVQISRGDQRVADHRRPSLIWPLYDYYLRPGGEYFGAKKACEPLHPLYSYDDHSIWVVNSSYQDVQKLRLTTRVYNLDLTEKYSHQAMLDAPADSSSNSFLLPDLD